MINIQQNIVILYGLISLMALVKGVYETKTKQNPYGLTPFGILGMFVWGDAVVIGIFWLIATLFVLLMDNWIIALLTLSLFWVVRSAGEVLYWFLQQFATHKRDLPETVPWNKFFPGESVWFAQQLWWQMVLVASLLATILLVKHL